MFANTGRLILATLSIMREREENIGSYNNWAAINAMSYICGIKPEDLLMAARAYRRYINAGGTNREAIIDQLEAYLFCHTEALITVTYF